MRNKDFDYGRYYQQFSINDEENIDKQISFNMVFLNPLKTLDRGSNILEIGCGRGFTMLTLEKMGFHNIKGIDIDDSQIDFGKKLGLNVELVEDTVDFLNQCKEQYDAVIAFDVFEHMHKDELVLVLSKIYSLLKKEGVLICKVPNANHPLSMRYRYIDWTHYISFTEMSLDFILYNSGFQSISVYEEPYVRIENNLVKNVLCEFLWKWNRWRIHFRYAMEFGRAGFKIPTTLNIMAEARKEG